MSHALELGNISDDGTLLHSKETFWGRYRRHLVTELRATLLEIRTCIAVVLALSYGFKEYLFQFDIPTTIKGDVVPPLLVYLIGMYLTLIPGGIIMLITGLYIAFPIKQLRIGIFGVLGLSAFLSLFIVFLV